MWRDVNVQIGKCREKTSMEEMKGEAASATEMLWVVRHEITAGENEVKCQGHGSAGRREDGASKVKPQPDISRTDGK